MGSAEVFVHEPLDVGLGVAAEEALEFVGEAVVFGSGDDRGFQAAD